MADVQAANAADYDIEPYVGMPIYFDDQGKLLGFGANNRCIVSNGTTEGNNRGNQNSIGGATGDSGVFRPENQGTQGMGNNQNMQGNQGMQNNQGMQGNQGSQNMENNTDMQGNQTRWNTENNTDVQGNQHMENNTSMQGNQSNQGTHNNQNFQSTVCSRDFESWPLAMAYVPWQRFNKTYSPEDGLEAGTIFPELDLPFLGGGRR